MYNMNPDLPYNLNFVGLCLIQFASVTTLMSAYRAVKSGEEHVMSSTREFGKSKMLERRRPIHYLMRLSFVGWGRRCCACLTFCVFANPAFQLAW
jgi:hypothetical protein